jgi:hypothetical protein
MASRAQRTGKPNPLDIIRRRAGLQALVLIFPSLFWLTVLFAVPLLIVFVYSS